MAFNFTLFVELIGAPGSGKSTLAHELVGQLSKAGFVTEYVHEVAKHLCWREHYNLMGNQLYVSGLQYEQYLALNGKAQIVLTDTAMLNGICYRQENMPASLDDVLLGLYKLKPLATNAIGFFIERGAFAYSPHGRREDESELVELSNKLLALATKAYGNKLLYRTDATAQYIGELYKICSELRIMSRSAMSQAYFRALDILPS